MRRRRFNWLSALSSSGIRLSIPCFSTGPILPLGTDDMALESKPRSKVNVILVGYFDVFMGNGPGLDEAVGWDKEHGA